MSEAKVSSRIFPLATCIRPPAPEIRDSRTLADLGVPQLPSRSAFPETNQKEWMGGGGEGDRKVLPNFQI